MPESFIYACLGGLLIGLASIMLLALTGKVAGISGIFWRAIQNIPDAKHRDYNWRWLFLTGLIIGPLLAYQVLGFAQPAASEAGPILAAIAGLCVGFGSRLGNGCTSGHGICGIGRLSIRSMTATITFMASGIITVFISQQIL